MRLAHRIGRRGASLLFFATLDFVYSLSLFAPAPEHRRSSSLVFLSQIMPLWCWGTLWGVVGLVCLVGAFTTRDRWAFAAATSLKVLWGGIILLGWLLAGLERGWLSAAVWLVFAGFVYIVSGWAEPPIQAKAERGEVPWIPPSS